MRPKWKIRLKGSCWCFSSKNKLGLRRNTLVCDCNLNDLKFILLHKKTVRPIRLCKALMKASIFTRRDIDVIFYIMYRKPCNYYTFTKAKLFLEQEGYYIFKDEYKIIKTYDKYKL